LLDLPHDVAGIALNLEEDKVGAVLFGEYEKIKEGDEVRRTKRIMSVRSARRWSGASSIIGPAARRRGPIESDLYKPAGKIAPGVDGPAPCASRVTGSSQRPM